MSIEEQKIEKLRLWIESEKQKCRDNGDEFFLSHPDKWYEDVNGNPTYADINGHISHRYLKSELKGNVCLECQEPVWLCPSETTEEMLNKILNS